MKDNYLGISGFGKCVLNILKINLKNAQSYLPYAFLKCYISNGFLLRAIIKKASDLEYRIQRRALFKEDFINYVQVSE